MSSVRQQRTEKSPRIGERHDLTDEIDINLKAMDRSVSDARLRQAMEIAMSSRSDLDTDLAQLTSDTTQLTNENARLRRINAGMLAALKFALPVLQDGLPESVDFDWMKEAVAKVQDAIAEAEGAP